MTIYYHFCFYYFCYNCSLISEKVNKTFKNSFFLKLDFWNHRLQKNICCKPNIELILYWKCSIWINRMFISSYSCLQVSTHNDFHSLTLWRSQNFYSALLSPQEFVFVGYCIFKTPDSIEPLSKQRSQRKGLKFLLSLPVTNFPGRVLSCRIYLITLSHIFPCHD